MLTAARALHPVLRRRKLQGEFTKQNLFALRCHKSFLATGCSTHDSWAPGITAQLELSYDPLSDYFWTIMLAEKV
jgi:hypothetical protein